MRKYWVLYAQVQNFEKLNIQVRETIVKIKDKIEKMSILHDSRAVKLVLIEAIKIMSYVFKRFWVIKVIKENLKDIAALSNKEKDLINSMFIVFSVVMRVFTIYYETDLLLKFHVADAFVDENRSLDDNLQFKVNKVIQVIKFEFYDWCVTFKKSLKKDDLTLKFFYDEALFLCHKLQLQITSNMKRESVVIVYIKSWSFSLLILNKSIESTDDHKYKLFDVINTSNLDDHVDLLNLLFIITSFLQQFFAMLYTESLLTFF